MPTFNEENATNNSSGNTTFNSGYKAELTLVAPNGAEINLTKFLWFKDDSDDDVKLRKTMESVPGGVLKYTVIKTGADADAMDDFLADAAKPAETSNPLPADDAANVVTPVSNTA